MWTEDSRGQQRTSEDSRGQSSFSCCGRGRSESGNVFLVWIRFLFVDQSYFMILFDQNRLETCFLSDRENSFYFLTNELVSLLSC